MPKDHYVSQTYLKRFGDTAKGGMLNAYRKSDGGQFPCWPRDVCTEWDGDLNPEWFPDRSGALGELRNVFEPLWTPSVQSIQDRQVADEQKYAIALMVSNLMSCTPAWRRCAAEMQAFLTTEALLFSSRMEEKHKGKSRLLRKAIQALEDGEIYLDVDDDRVRAQATMNIPDFGWNLFHQNWRILENDTHLPFVTSDNPVTIHPTSLDQNVRHLAITPYLCLIISMERQDLPERTGFVPSLGSVGYAKATEKDVRQLNTITIMCAEDLVFSKESNKGLAKIVAQYSDFGVINEGALFSNPVNSNEQIQLTSIAIGKRTKDQ